VKRVTLYLSCRRETALGDPVCCIRRSCATGPRRIFKPWKKEEAGAWKNGINKSYVTFTFHLIPSGELNQRSCSDEDMGHALEKVRNALKIFGQLQERKQYSLVLITVIKSILEKRGIF